MNILQKTQGRQLRLLNGRAAAGMMNKINKSASNRSVGRSGILQKLDVDVEGFRTA